MFKCVPFILSLSIFLIGQQIPDGEPLLLKPPREEVSRGLSYYENILRKNPDLPEAHFGAGHSAYSIENYERAQQEFKASSQSERKDLQSKSHYNLGNTLHRQGRLEESLMAFRKAIQLDPSDMDAKYNYELTQQMLRQMQSQEQSKPQQSDQDQNDENKKQDQQQPQPPPEQEQQDQNQIPEDQQEQEQQQPQQDKPNAESILDALKADEENLMKRKLGHVRSKKLTKDW